MNFADQIKAFAEKTSSSLDESCRAIKIKLFTGIIMGTRVDKGRLRGNWQTSTGSPIYKEIDRLDKTGEIVTPEMIAKITAFGKDYLSNNLPYAKKWADKDALIHRNFAKINRILKEVTKT